jgi:hypothetical protein
MRYVWTLWRSWTSAVNDSQLSTGVFWAAIEIWCETQQARVK